MAYIGKNIIENLTTAMYNNSRIVYREYIQNSADGIDKAVSAGILQPKDASIYIKIEPQIRKITIEDNGYGIPKADFKKIMESIADSQKSVDNNKGFRGIGRLGGISVCDELRFTTSAKGENVESVCVWNAKLIKEILADHDNKIDAASLVDKSTSYKENACEKEGHYFKVELIKVSKNAEDLLNVEAISDYISAIAPVPYSSSFCYKDPIRKYAADNGFNIDEYRVLINQEQIFKPYVTDLYTPIGNSGKKEKYDSIYDVKFEMFVDDNDKPLAWMWYGISRFEKKIPAINQMRGLRLRKGNIQIGDENTLITQKFFKEERGNFYFVGEIFAVSPLLIPNARRDYFNFNNECRFFEKALRNLTYDTFYSMYHKANDIKKDLQRIQEYEKAYREFNANLAEGKFIDEASKNKAASELNTKKNKAEKAKATLERQKEKYNADDVLSKVFDKLSKKYPSHGSEVAEGSPKYGGSKANPDEGATTVKKKTSYRTQGLTKYGKKEQKLVSRIYKTIQAVLPPDQATCLIDKIQEDLMK